MMSKEIDPDKLVMLGVLIAFVAGWVYIAIKSMDKDISKKHVPESDK